MKLLDRYIYKKFFTTFGILLGIFNLFIILIHTTENINSFRQHHLHFGQIFRYYCLFLPYMVNFLLPIIVFSTTIWVTSRLAQRSEIIAILSSGVSFHRLAMPYWLVSLLLMGINFYLTGWLLAKTNQERIAFETTYLDMGFSVKSEYIQLKVGENQCLYIEKYHAHNNTGYNINLDTFQNEVLKEQLHAKKMTWDPKKQTWDFFYWEKRTFYPKHEEINKGYKLTLPLDIFPEDFSINPNLKEGLTIPELYVHIQKLLDKGNETASIFIAEKHIRYMTPFSIIILMTLGFLVSTYKPRKGMSKQIVAGFVLACLYIALFLAAKTVIEIQSAHPLLDIWIPNILFTGLCLIGYRMIPK